MQEAGRDFGLVASTLGADGSHAISPVSHLSLEGQEADSSHEDPSI